MHPESHRVAACKVVTITPDFSDWQMKSMEKECRVHTALKNRHILELIGAAKLTIDQAKRGGYLPAWYLLMEMAAGGDLFDKIGLFFVMNLNCTCSIDEGVSSTGRRHQRGRRALLLLPDARWPCAYPRAPMSCDTCR